ncbi:hypothetical protein OHA72_49620 [Dactylosporangium sp. NBC_01737]|uniref:hypothetical protein n=1 Tax=Dactylosporangium sp. NBC_01737 TaxID=2975959 RepID=UPI002E1681A2|nr:hypothetical protein OHA72_49620 [Dactylosporangium sp. NBC_01737]
MNRTAAALAALAAGLLAAFFAAPPALLGNPSASFRGAFVEYWRTGERNLTPRLRTIVDDWFRYHLLKAATAALLLVVLVALGAVLWKAFQRGAGRRGAVASAGVAVTVLALFSLAMVMANLQGMGAPFASLLPTLVDGAAPDAALSGTLGEVRQRLAASPAPPAVDVMVDDFAHYHAVMAVIATVAAAALLALSVVAWRRFARVGTDRRAAGAFGALMALSSLAVAVIAVANTTVAADPAPALAAFFDGGW